MLTKRTNILFDQNTWQLLTHQAKTERRSVGDIVRTAVHTMYQTQSDLKKRQAAIDQILAVRPKPFKGKIDYKALINEGRKY